MYMISSYSDEEKEYVSGEIIVKYDENVIINDAHVIGEMVGAKVIDTLEIEKLTPSQSVYRIAFDETVSLSAMLERYAAIDEVVYAEPNYILRNVDDFLPDVVPNDQNYSSLWGLRVINAERAWNLTTGNVSIAIAVIDTGVDWDHPDLALNIWNNSDEFCNATLDNDGNGYAGDCRGYDFVNVSSGCADNDCDTEDNNPVDYHGHGTHISGIIAAVTHNSIGVSGVCWNCSIMPVRAGYQDSDGNGALTVSDVIQALHYSSDNNATVISMSFGGSHSAALQDAINYSYSNGSILVASSGNSGTNTAIYPCAYSNVICVAAINEDNSSAGYSNYGSWVPVSAPGTNVVSTYFDNGYATQSGTSMATPYVSGSIGLIKTLFPSKNQSEIKTALNTTGTSVNFNGVTIPRINIYEALLSLDSFAPNVSLVTPPHLNLNRSQNITFVCNATDWQLANMTFFLWNTTQLFYNETKDISGIFNQSSFTVNSIPINSYTWNCRATDSKNNRAYASTNFSVSIGNITVSLLSPNDNSFTNISQATFNCSSQTIETYSLTNATFYLWNASGLVTNTVKNISGTTNTTSFSYNFSLEGPYSWNCKYYNNRSEFESFLTNYSLTYDITNPNLAFISPPNESSYSSNLQTIDFIFNVSDTVNVSNCSLLIGGVVNLTNSSLIQTATQNFSQSFQAGSYQWNVRCSDFASNSNTSAMRTVTVNAISSGSAGSGGGGGSGGASITSFKTYIPSNEEVTEGYTQTLRSKDQIKLLFFDKNLESHYLTINNVTLQSVSITIQSNPITLLLSIGQSAKLNLTHADSYDLLVKVDSISDGTVKLTIQLINEPMLPRITGDIVQEATQEELLETTGSESIDEELAQLKKDIREMKLLFSGFVLIIVIVIIFLVYHGKTSSSQSKRKNIKIKKT